MARAFPVRRVTKPERDQHELDPIANVAGVTPKPSLQPAARSHSVQVAVDVKLQQSPGAYAGRPVTFGATRPNPAAARSSFRIAVERRYQRISRRSGVERTYRKHGRIDAIDPIRTSRRIF